MTDENERKRKRRIIILWSLIGFLFVTNSVTIWLWMTSKNEIVRERIIREKVLVERDNVRNDLLTLQKEYQTLQATDAAMQKDIDEKRTRIEQLLKEAEKHKNDRYIISKLRKEAESLRTIMKGFVHTIDSLNTLNQTLVAEKQTVLKQLDVEIEKQETLNREKDVLKTTIAKGSILTAFNVSAQAVTLKRSGAKESTTNKARKTDKIKVSFSLGENKIARAGEKTVFVRVMTPDGKEMAKSYDENSKFAFNKSVGYFAGKEVLNYANVEMNGVVYCEGQGEYVPGTYLIEITCDGVVIGNTSLKLD
jgi:hypothetical protein